jgi:hypothetical protein
VIILAGGYYDDAGRPGVAATTAAMSTEGTTTRTAREIADLLARAGASADVSLTVQRYYYLSLYGSVALSATSALVLKLETIRGPWQTDVAASCAAAAATLGTAITAGAFKRR